MSGGRRSALVVANDTYQDQRLRRLRAPATDAEHLARVLRDADIGGFDVEVSLNEPEHVVRRNASHDPSFFDIAGWQSDRTSSASDAVRRRRRSWSGSTVAVGSS